MFALSFRWFRSHTVSEMDVATKEDVGAGAIDQTAVPAHNDGPGMLLVHV